MGVRWAGTGVALGRLGATVGTAVGSGGTVTLSGKGSAVVVGKDVLSGVVACSDGTTQTGVLIESGDGAVSADGVEAGVGAADLGVAVGDRGAPKVIAG